MPGSERQQVVLDLLNRLPLGGLDPLKELFWAQFSYGRVNKPLSRRGWSETAASALAEDPLLFAAGGEDNQFQVIYARLNSDKLLLGWERPVVTTLLRGHPYALFVVSNASRELWHFINVRADEDLEKRRLFRRITIGRDERLRTAAERIEMLDLAGMPDPSPLGIQRQHDEAFDVEKVTRLFFDDYRAVFQVLWDDLRRQSKDRSWAHDYALQFLNRLMFLYFIQRKGWLGGDREFLQTFWESYGKSAASRDTFVEKWLNVLFFQAFNDRLTSVPKYFPEQVREAVAFAPYLNGGLFSPNELDRRCERFDAAIRDKRFQRVFDFFQRYNFTIAEDSPLDQEVAVDPEMIGKVYESLVNVSEEPDERGDAGTQSPKWWRLVVYGVLLQRQAKSCLRRHPWRGASDSKSNELARPRLHRGPKPARVDAERQHIVKGRNAQNVMRAASQYPSQPGQFLHWEWSTANVHVQAQSYLPQHSSRKPRHRSVRVATGVHGGDSGVRNRGRVERRAERGKLDG